MTFLILYKKIVKTVKNIHMKTTKLFFTILFSALLLIEDDSAAHLIMRVAKKY